MPSTVPDVPGTFTINNIEIFEEGVWNRTKITSKTIDDLIESFGQVPGLKPALTLEHDDEKTKKALKPRLGTVTRVFRKGPKLFADIKNIPKIVYESIKNQSFNSISIQMLRNLKSFAADKTFPAVLGHVTLLGAIPKAVETLKDITDLFELNAEDYAYEELQDLAYDFKCHCNKLESCDMSDCNHAVDNKNTEDSDMSEKELQALKDDFKTKEEAWETEKEDFEKKIKLLSDQVSEATAGKDSFSKSVGDLEAKVTKLETDKRNTEIENFVADMVRKGKVLPAQKDQKIIILKAASDEKAHDFKQGEVTTKVSHREMIENEIKFGNTLVEMGEMATQAESTEGRDAASSEHDSPGDKLDALAEEYMKKNTDVKEYSEALAIITSMPEHAELVRDHQEFSYRG